jgi:hypothetical protein
LHERMLAKFRYEVMNDEILITASSFFHTARVAFWWASLYAPFPPSNGRVPGRCARPKF